MGRGLGSPALATPINNNRYLLTCTQDFAGGSVLNMLLHGYTYISPYKPTVLLCTTGNVF